MRVFYEKLPTAIFAVGLDLCLNMNKWNVAPNKTVIFRFCNPDTCFYTTTIVFSIIDMIYRITYNTSRVIR